MGESGPRIPTRRVTRILVADGDRAFALFGRYVLRQVGCDVDMAESPDDALGLIRDRSRHYSAVLVDPAFEDTEGDSVCRQLFALRPEAAHVLVSECAAVGTEPHDGWLRKPYQPAALVQAVTAAIEARAIRRRREADLATTSVTAPLA
jgi:DNA-binding response OmpR family regulator